MKYITQSNVIQPWIRLFIKAYFHQESILMSFIFYVNSVGDWFLTSDSLFPKRPWKKSLWLQIRLIKMTCRKIVASRSILSQRWKTVTLSLFSIRQSSPDMTTPHLSISPWKSVQNIWLEVKLYSHTAKYKTLPKSMIIKIYFFKQMGKDSSSIELSYLSESFN